MKTLASIRDVWNRLDPQKKVTFAGLLVELLGDLILHEKIYNKMANDIIDTLISLAEEEKDKEVKDFIMQSMNFVLMVGGE